jgi:hypothetical protein
MKRYVCAVTAGMLLALAGAGTAAAGLPLPGPVSGATQSATYGDQSIDKRRNDADVQQSQGNGNVNVSPAISLFGDSSTSNDQGNGNVAVAKVDQSNEATQSESASQTQTDQNDGGCCKAESQPAEQSSSFGNQSIGEQKNDADVDQYQGNGNVNVSPAIAVFGDASTWNSQGNDNVAIAKVEQSNEATQTESSWQNQNVDSNDGSCCKGQSQPAEQSTTFGDQSLGKQRNDADVQQSQGNGNVNVSPAIAVPIKPHDECRSDGTYGTSSWGKCDTPHAVGGASTWNDQGNGNVAFAKVGQSNTAAQSQSAWQSQTLGQCCREVMRW